MTLTVHRKIPTDLICYYCKKPLDCDNIVTESETRMTLEYKCHHCKQVWYKEID